MKSICMNCKYFKIEDEFTGYCRVAVYGKKEKKTEQNPMVLQDNFCEKWQDCGQQYYIRLGWLKAQKKKAGL